MKVGELFRCRRASASTLDGYSSGDTQGDQTSQSHKEIAYGPPFSILSTTPIARMFDTDSICRAAVTNGIGCPSTIGMEKLAACRCPQPP